ncbi:hypothetical protein J5N97_015063 [Dioscorea zingiberensis]|uniref:RING-type domain-containing protein n=1 Tax=Dioscorea zingiberensis TaxID=325984 RepID=A0A9D5CVD4_9LILI|nr:hypothetical protein J5N97_015063 [Dioscorea zingiberensis]
MGFDNECILNIQTLPGEYFCPVCRTLVYPNEALQAQCTHLYCKPCLAYVVATTHACPYDGYLVTESDSKPLIESNKSIVEAIGKVAVYCLYHRSGCQWQGTLTECIAHCTECSFGNSPVICNRCGTQIIHRQVQEHAQSCPGLQPQSQQVDNTQTQVSTGQTQIGTQDSSITSSTTTGMPVASSTPSAQMVAATSTKSVASASDSTPAASDQAAQTQATVIAQQQAVSQAPPADQWYQQQQMQYQQYYQQYPGYDPYQQQYQHYGQYQQHAQQYPQAYMQVPVQPVVQGQQQSLHNMQPQPQPQPQSQLLVQTQQPPLQPQPQGQAVQPQTQPPVQTAQPQPQQQQHYPQMQPHPQQPQHHSHIQLHVPAQQVLPQTQPQNHPPPYAQMPGQPQTHPHPHSLPPQFPTHPHPQLQQTLPPQSHPHSQMQHMQPPPQQPHMQQLPHPQPHLRPQGQPIPQSQPQQPAAQAVTGHQSYPQPYPFQPAHSGAPQQRPVHMHPQHPSVPHQPAQYPGQMQNQFPSQQTQMRPPPNSVPVQAQQPGMLPPQGSRGLAIPSLQPGQQFHHHVGPQPVSHQQILPQQQVQGQLHPTQQYQQGSPLPQQSVRSQAPILQQQIPTQSPFQQNVAAAQGVPSHQVQSRALRPTIINHGAPQQASQQIPSQNYLSEANLNLTRSSELQAGTTQHTQVAPSNSHGSLPPQPSALQSGADVNQNQVSAAKESSRLIASEMQGKSSPDTAAQLHKLDAGTEPKNSMGTESVLTKIPRNESDPVSILHEGKANADSNDNNQPNIDGKGVQESAHVAVAQSDNLDEQVVEHAPDKEVTDYRNDEKEISNLSTAQREILSNETGGGQSLPDLKGSLGSSQSKQGPVADVVPGIPPAGSFPGEEKHLRQPPAPDRIVPPHMSHPVAGQERFPEFPPSQMQQHGPLLGPSQMHLPLHNLPESRPPLGQGRQPYGPYSNEVSQTGHLDPGISNFSSTGALVQNHIPLPVNGPPAGVFGAAGGMMSNPPGLENPVGQPRHADVINGDHSKGPVGGTERFGSFPEERFRPFPEDRFRTSVQDPHRRVTNPGELEEDLKQFPKSTQLDSEGLPKFDGHYSSSRPVEGSRPLGGPFPPNSSGSTLLPREIREHRKPGGIIHDEWGRRPDSLGAIPGVGSHLMGSLPPLRSPGREYAGFEMRKFGFSKQSTDNFGKEPLNFSGRSNAFYMPSDSFGSSFSESRFPRPYAPGPSNFPGGSSDRPQHMRMFDQLPSRNLPGDRGNDLDGPGIRPSHFRHERGNEAFGGRDFPSNLRVGEPLGRSHHHLGEPGGFGGIHRDTRVGEPSFPGHFPPHMKESIGGGYLPVHMRSGEPGPARSYSMHGFPNETGRFGWVSTFDDIGSFEHSSKRNFGGMGWCRICRIDCGNVEGLDIHSQTREHQKMAMDIVLSIKQENSKKKKKALEDGTAIEGSSKSRKVKF